MDATILSGSTLALSAQNHAVNCWLPVRRLTAEVKRLYSSLRGSHGRPDEEAIDHLVSLIHALTACVSFLHESKHETLLSQLLNIKLWTVAEVGCSSQAYKSFCCV